MKKVFCTSDTHFGHYNIIKYCNRPFRTANEMDSILIDNINKAVGVNDVLIHAGDFSFGDINTIINYRNRINCRTIVLITGNHDKVIVQNRVSCLQNKVFHAILDFLIVKIDGYIAVINHYPQGIDRRLDVRYVNQLIDNCGAAYLHGHQHSNKVEDIGVDNPDLNYKPMWLGDIEDNFLEKMLNGEKI